MSKPQNIAQELRQVEALTERLSAELAEAPGNVIGAVLADLLSLLIMTQKPVHREALLDFHMAHVKELMEVRGQAQ